MSERDLYLDLPEHVILALALQAHELDITLNEHMNNIIREKCLQVLSDE